MNSLKIVAIVLIVGGLLGLAYGGFSYTRETHHAQVGPIVLSVDEKKTVDVPLWAGVAAVAAGVLLLAFGARRP